MGVAKGDRVALWGYNSVNWLVAFFAIVRAGGVAALVNYSLSVDETATLLRDVQARFVVFGDNGQTKLRDDIVDALSYAAGIEYVIDKRRDTSISANIILRSVDNFHTEYFRGKPRYCMDFLYENYVDIKAFLLKHKETVE